MQLPKKQLIRYGPAHLSGLSGQSNEMMARKTSPIKELKTWALLRETNKQERNDAEG